MEDSKEKKSLVGQYYIAVSIDQLHIEDNLVIEDFDHADIYDWTIEDVREEIDGLLMYEYQSYEGLHGYLTEEECDEEDLDYTGEISSNVNYFIGKILSVDEDNDTITVEEVCI